MHIKESAQSHQQDEKKLHLLLKNITKKLTMRNKSIPKNKKNNKKIKIKKIMKQRGGGEKKKKKKFPEFRKKKKEKKKNNYFCLNVPIITSCFEKKRRKE